MIRRFLRRLFRVSDTPQWARGMRRTGPGLYWDGVQLHVAMRELADHFHIPLTANNAAMIVLNITRAVQSVYPKAEVIVKEVSRKA